MFKVAFRYLASEAISRSGSSELVLVLFYLVYVQFLSSWLKTLNSHYNFFGLVILEANSVMMPV